MIKYGGDLVKEVKEEFSCSQPKGKLFRKRFLLHFSQEVFLLKILVYGDFPNVGMKPVKYGTDTIKRVFKLENFSNFIIELSLVCCTIENTIEK